MGELIIRPHPERETPEVRRLRLDLETDAVAMRIVIEHEATQGRLKGGRSINPNVVLKRASVA